MGIDRIGNIRCVIRDGRAYLAVGDRQSRDCHGSCSACISFLGVDIRQVGQPYLEGDCCNPAYLTRGVEEPLIRIQSA